MARVAISTTLLFMLVAGCTATPERYKKSQQLPTQQSSPVLFGQGGASALSVDNLNSNKAKAQTVATASIGIPEIYVDPEMGQSVELLVQSEYFSANGRVCRRYTEFTDGQSVPGVSCKDDVAGWVDIPLSAFVR